MADGRPSSMAERLRRLQPAPEASRVRRAQQQLAPVEYDPAGGRPCLCWLPTAIGAFAGQKPHSLRWMRAAGRAAGGGRSSWPPHPRSSATCARPLYTAQLGCSLPRQQALVRCFVLTPPCSRRRVLSCPPAPGGAARGAGGPGLGWLPSPLCSCVLRRLRSPSQSADKALEPCRACIPAGPARLLGSAAWRNRLPSCRRWAPHPLECLECRWAPTSCASPQRWCQRRWMPRCWG